MDEFLLNTFASYYKRIMRVEAFLKENIIQKYIALYNKNNVYKITYAQFFSKIENNKHSKDRIYTKLHDSNKTDNEKFMQAINKMYLSELTNFFGHRVYFKNKIRKTFFKIDVDTKTTEFQSNTRNLNEFRNCVAHIDVKKFNIDFKKMLSGLEYFERLLGFNDVLTISNLYKINAKHKLSTSDILKLIYNSNKKAFENDKILIAMFDEIALLNGYEFETLPQRWTIVRQKYDIEKNANPKNLENDGKNQLKLSFDINEQ